jgi:hypothetical protein
MLGAILLSTVVPSSKIKSLILTVIYIPQVAYFGCFYHRLVDADQATKDYMAKTFNIHIQSFTAPEDPYQTFRKTMEPGAADSWGKFRCKKDENKLFVEAQLGNTLDTSSREGFMRYGSQALKFRCIWDNTKHLYGDVLEYSLAYYLNDDTIEINSIPAKEQSRQKLLKRSKLPKDFHIHLTLGERPSSDAFFHWTDIYIGFELEVYARYLKVIDADEPTRAFYSNHGFDLGSPIIQPTPEVRVYTHQVPPPTGFGSEEDSLRSVAGPLMPGPPPAKKHGENATLTFLAGLLSGSVNDKERRFVISFYVADDTMSVSEPPRPNSGFAGGTFLSRRAIKKCSGEPLTVHDLYVGCRLRVLMHEFLLLGASEGTYRWMEEKGLLRSDFYAIVDKMRPMVYSDASSGVLAVAFQDVETPEGGRGNASINGLRQVLSRYGVAGDRPEDVSEHEMVTILRANGNKSSTFNYEKLIQQIVHPTDEFK